MNRTALATAVLVVSATLLGAVGCSTPGGGGPPSVSAAPSTQPLVTAVPAGTGIDFWYALARKRSVTNDEWTRSLLSSIDDPAAALDYPARVADMKAKGLLPRGFNAPPDAKLRRGDLAVALCKVMKIDGGATARLTSGLTGNLPRYATRALVFEGIYPESTENQSFTGTEFVGVVGAIDDRRRGNPTDRPAEEIPGYQSPTVALDGPPTLDYRLLPLVYTAPSGDAPIYLMLQDGTAAPVGATTQGAPRKLKVFVTAVQGDQAEFRRKPGAAWEKAKPGVILDENAEFRTGDKSSIRFNIPPGQTFTVDRLSTCRVAEAAFDGANKVTTTVAMEQGRVRMDVNPTGPDSALQVRKVDESAFNISEAGVVHDTTIKSPNSALAVRGTKVSLLDQPPYAPLATSLTGRAEYLNTRRQAVAFGAAGRRSQVEGDQDSAAGAAAQRSVAAIPPAATASSFDVAQLNRVLATGGFLRGDVLVGNAGVDVTRDFSNASLGFVLQFGKPGDTEFQDLNLAVVSPLSGQNGQIDFVANGPFTTALNPKAPGYEAFRAANYPRTSPSGGSISRNSVSAPESFSARGGSSSFRGVEAAFWGSNYPRGTYRVLVTNFIDATGSPEGKGSNPIPFIVNVISNGKSLGVLGGFNQTVGLYDTTQLNFDTSQIPASDTLRVVKRGKAKSKK